MGFSFGSDPEFMVEKEDGTLVSAIKVLKGFGKYNKLSVPHDQNTFYDNVLMEFNVAPSATFRDFEEHFTTCLRFANELLGKDGLRLRQQSSATFPLSECMDKESLEFGCDPEFSIYKIKDGIIQQLNPPKLPKGNTFRSCGGHIHIGHPIATLDGGNPQMVVKMMDLFVGNTALLINHDPTADARREIYGGAGTHRLADYGLEYRTLSNFWLRGPAWAEVIYRLTRLAVQLAVARPELASSLATDKETENIINTGNKEAAETLFKKTSKFMSDDLQDRIANVRHFQPSYMEVEWGIRKEAQQKAQAV